MLTASKRMLSQKELKEPTNTKSWSITNRYETIIIGDPFCGKSTYLNMLVTSERKSNAPVMISDDKNEFEFVVESKSKKAIFIVKDTANQERFRSLTQSYYRKAQCVLLIFNLDNPESFYNLEKWYVDSMNYCKKQDNKFAIVLIGIKKNTTNGISNSIDSNKSSSQSSSIKQELIEKFQQEQDYIIGYCEIDLMSQENLKEPFELLLEHFLSLNESKMLQTNYFKRESEPKITSNNNNNNDKSSFSLNNSNFENDSSIEASTNKKFNNLQENNRNKEENIKKPCCIII